MTSPSLDSGQVVRKVVARSGVNLEVVEDLLELFDGLDEVKVLQIAKHGLDTVDDRR